MAASRFDKAMNWREFARVYRMAGRAIFQLSPEKMELRSETRREVAGMEGGTRLVSSWRAAVMEMPSLITSARKTAVEGT